MDEEWRLKAACRGHAHPEYWFPEGSRYTDAQDICRRCPVRRPCGLAAVRTKERYGIRAGFRCNEAKGRAQMRRWLGLITAEEARKCRSCAAPVDGYLLLCDTCTHTSQMEEAVRLYVERLRVHYTVAEIARRAQMSRGTLYDLVYPRRGRARRRAYVSNEHAGRLLAIEIPDRTAS